MRLARRVLLFLALAVILLLLFQTWESYIGTAAVDKVLPGSNAKAKGETETETTSTESERIPAQLPQVILPHETVSSSSDSISDDQKSTTGDSDVDQLINPEDDGQQHQQSLPSDIGTFWMKWSNAIYSARPRSPRINHASQASTVQSKDNDKQRKPYPNLIVNPDEDIESLRAAHAYFVRDLENELGPKSKDISSSENGAEFPAPARQWQGTSDVFKGHGVVMVGGGEYFGPAIIGIHMLRRTGSSLPVEVFVPDDGEYEKEVCEGYLPRLNAKCVVLSHILAKSDLKVGQDDAADLKITHYQLKCISLLLSSFSDVLLLDSDSIPLEDPLTDIFDTEPYTSRGLVGWPDFWQATESPKFWTIAGKSTFPSNLPTSSSEAGQLAINKSTHLAPLLLATYYNIFGPDYYYPLLSQGALGQGDKETFLAAAVALNTTYYRVKTQPGRLGRRDGTLDKGTALIQHSPKDDLKYSLAQGDRGNNKDVRPIFLHSNTPKMNAGHLVDEGDLLTHDGKKRLRLLGSKDEQLKLFGFDLERSIWDLLVQSGCELGGVIKEWVHRERLCDRLEEHYAEVFGNMNQ